LGIDLGSVKTGVAVSQADMAVPLKTVIQTSLGGLARDILEIVGEKNIDKVVIGYPKNMNGTRGPMCKKVDKFVEILQNLCGSVNIIKWDERLTTKMAIGNMIESGAKFKTKKAHENEAAAVIILQNYLDYDARNIQK
jgi:putative Holliday junction resolvase